MTDHVYIATDIARKADHYHTHTDCQSASDSTLTQIALGTAKNNALEKCGMCVRKDGEAGPQYGLAKELADTDVDDVLPGGQA